MAKSKHQKTALIKNKNSSKFILVSKFNIYTVHLKCFDSIKYHLNQYKTLTKNFNQGLNSGELDMFPGTWGCPRHVRFACHTSSMHIQSTKALYIHSKLDMFPGTWGCPRHGRFACHTSSMHEQSTKAKSKHQKQQYLFLISSKFVMVSKFNIYTVHLKCFDSIRYHLNQYKTLTKNFNQGLNSGELVWKMAKSKHQKQH